ncbi:MAG: acylphosphatase [Streptosporangiales bacterium]|nr:acylphosphatase [Streptosporangiales bacterium]MBO0891977.1 acylphosphatase [Acidothermales bacterium]
MGTEPTVRTRVVASGLVQGVFFRETCRREARRAGVTGWVRNRPDGTVEAVFEGPPESVERMVAWCRRGPSRAHVRGLTTLPEEPEGLREFEVA